MNKRRYGPKEYAQKLKLDGGGQLEQTIALYAEYICKECLIVTLKDTKNGYTYYFKFNEWVCHEL